MSYLSDQRPFRLGDFARMKQAGDKITSLTAYDSSFASLLDRCGVEILLVGDSLGNVVQGHSSTLPVRMEDMIYHTQCVAAGTKRAFIMSDMPFGSYQTNHDDAMRNAARLMAAGAQAVKVEGGAYIADTVRFLVERGVPVCAHIGLTPQSVHQLGGYKVQGATVDSAQKLIDDAISLEHAGASFMVLEMVPSDLAARITQRLTHCATIGIGAGPSCAGQVLVMHDMLGIFDRKRPRFVKDFMTGAGSIEAAIKAYVADVKSGAFPAPEHCYPSQ
jgi:3-methyl-2-oxobutanoate hydroxymethyltransferase